MDSFEVDGFVFPNGIWFLATAPPFSDIDELCSAILVGLFDDDATGSVIPIVYAFSDPDLARKYIEDCGEASHYLPISNPNKQTTLSLLKGLQIHGHQFLGLDVEPKHAVIKRIGRVIDKLEGR